MSMVKLDKQQKERTSLRVDPDKYWTLKELAVHERTTMTELVDEAIDDILTKYRNRRSKK